MAESGLLGLSLCGCIPSAAVFSHQCTVWKTRWKGNTDPDSWSLFSFFSLPSSYSAPQSSSHQICQEKYPLQGWKSMKFQIQSQSDKMSLLAYLAWIEHSSGAPCLRLIWSRAYLCTKGPLLRSSPPTDNLGKSLHTKPNVSDDQKKSAHNQNALPNITLRHKYSRMEEMCFVHPDFFSGLTFLIYIFWNIRSENSNIIWGEHVSSSSFSENLLCIF